MNVVSTTDRSHGESIRVLHVDDEPDFAELTATFLQRENDQFVVETATSPTEGAERLSEGRFDCVVSDYDMPGQNGIEFLETVRGDHPDLPFILFTGKGSEEVASEAISAGVSDYLQKGTGTERYSLLANRIANLVAQHRAEIQLETRARQQQRAAELGQRAVAGESLETLFEWAVSAVVDTLDTDYAKVLEYRPTHDDLLLREGIGWQEGLVGEATVGTGEDSQAGHTLRSETPIVVEDLGTEDRFRGPPLLVDHGVVSGISVIIGSPDDPWGVLGTHTTERVAFTDDDVTFVQTVANILANAIDQQIHREQLRELTDQYEAVFTNAQEAIFLLDVGDETTFRIAQLNPVEEELLGVTSSEARGKTVYDLYDEETADRAVAPYRRCVEQGKPVTVVDEFELSGELRTFETKLAPVTNDGEITQLVGVSREITEERANERELERSNELLSTLIETLPVGILAEDETRDVLAVNERLFDLFEMPGSPAEVVGADCQQLATEVNEMFSDSDGFVQRIDELVSERTPVHGEELELRDGRTFVRSYDPIELPDGRGHLWVYRDITDRKAREDRLHETSSRLEVLFENSPDMIDVLDAEGTVLEVNRRFCEELGYDPEDVVGRPIWEIDQLVDAEDVATLLSEFDLDERRKFEGRYERRDGSTFPVEVHLLRLDLNGDDRFMAISRDITERKRREQRLQRQNEQLDEFASMVSHDLRTPLSVAEGYLELASEECVSDHLVDVARAHDRMGALIDDLLTLARNGEQIAELEAVDLAALTEDCWRNVTREGATLEADLDKSVRADRSRLQQLLENLLGNAIEHGGTGVTVTIGPLQDGFYVEDDGNGIPIEMWDEVFEAGYSTSEEGTGFGLSIVKQVVDAHGWNVRVSESDDGGARFEFTDVARPE